MIDKNDKQATLYNSQIMSHGTAKHVKLMMGLHTANGQIN